MDPNSHTAVSHHILNVAVLAPMFFSWLLQISPYVTAITGLLAMVYYIIIIAKALRRK